jgi:transcriptional regulator with XRE-family HTH domain
MADHPLKIFRKNHQLSQDELADKLGVSKSAISRWENGGRWPNRLIVRKISRITNGAVTANDFVSVR